MAVDVQQATVTMLDASTAHVLIFANYYVMLDPESQSQYRNGSFYPYQTLSQVWMFDEDQKIFIEHQTLSTQGPVDLEVFYFIGYTWLLIANSYDGSYSEIDSVLYRWEAGTASFVQYQRFPGTGARQWKHLSCGTGREFLALAQSSEANAGTTDIWHWRHHSFPVSPLSLSFASGDAEKALEGFSWVHVQNVQTESVVHIEGGLFGNSRSGTSGFSVPDVPLSGKGQSDASSACQLVLVGDCDSCSQVLQLVASGLFPLFATCLAWELLLAIKSCTDASLVRVLEQDHS
jgi:hypothetical protein